MDMIAYNYDYNDIYDNNKQFRLRICEHGVLKKYEFQTMICPLLIKMYIVLANVACALLSEFIVVAVCQDFSVALCR